MSSCVERHSSNVNRTMQSQICQAAASVLYCQGTQKVGTLMAAPAISRPLSCGMARVASAIFENLHTKRCPARHQQSGSVRQRPATLLTQQVTALERAASWMAWSQHTCELKSCKAGARDVAVPLALPRAVALDLHQVQRAVGREDVAHIILLQTARMQHIRNHAVA
jgi:hypothetical protein